MRPRMAWGWEQAQASSSRPPGPTKAPPLTCSFLCPELQVVTHRGNKWPFL